jgi:hypothetical protein
MTDWLKSIQSVGRGFRPGIEIKMVSAGRDTGKSVWMDIESDEFKPWREMMRPHYAEYCDHNTGETFWKKYNKSPPSSAAYNANTIIRHNEDGSYAYVKKRFDGELRKLTEQEAIWFILKAGV